MSYININSTFIYGSKGALDNKLTFGSGLPNVTLQDLIDNNFGLIYRGMRVVYAGSGTQSDLGREYKLTKSSGTINVSDFEFADNRRFFVENVVPTSLSDTTYVGDVFLNSSTGILYKKTSANAWTQSLTIGGLKISGSPESDNVAVFTSSDTVTGTSGLKFVNTGTSDLHGLYVDKKLQIRGVLNILKSSSNSSTIDGTDSSTADIFVGTHDSTDFTGGVSLLNLGSCAETINIGSSPINLRSGSVTRSINIGHSAQSKTVNVKIGSSKISTVVSNVFMYGNVEVDGQIYSKNKYQEINSTGTITLSLSDSNVHYIRLTGGDGLNTLSINSQKSGSTYIMFFQVDPNVLKTLRFPASFINMSDIVLPQSTDVKYYSWTGLCLEVGNDDFKYFGVFDEAAKNLI